MTDQSGSPPDPLAPFRAPGATSSARAATPPPNARYQAFAAASDGGKPPRLDIRPKSGMAMARPYSAIAEIAYDRGDYTGILLALPGRVVKLRGRCLKPVVEALIAGSCEYLAELPDGEQAQQGAPVIERIELLLPQAAS